MSRTASFLDAIDDRVTRTKFKQIDERLAKIEKPVQSGFIYINQESNLGNHAVKHASARAGLSNSGTDSLDKYEMDWKQKHLFQMTEDEVAITVKAPSAGSNSDLVNVLNRDSSNSFDIGVDGAVAFSGAVRTARVNIKPLAVSSAGTAPDVVAQYAPWIWLRLEDLLNQYTIADSTQWTADIKPFDMSGNNHVFIPSGPPTGLKFYDTSFHINNLAVLTPDGTDSTFAQISTGSSAPQANDGSAAWLAQGLEFSGAWTMFVVYKTTSSATQAYQPIIGNANNFTDKGATVAGYNASARYSVWYGGLEKQVSISHTTTSQNDRIAIVRRDSSGFHWVYATNNSGAGQEMTLGIGSNSGTQFFVNPATTIVFDELFTIGRQDDPNGENADPAVYLAELAIFKGDVGAVGALELYNYAATRYGLTATTDLAPSLDIQDDSSISQITVDKDGNMGLGSFVPQRRLHLEDADGNPQYRQAYDPDNYVEAEVDSSGQLSYTGVKSGASIAGTMPKIPRGTAPPTAADHPQELFLHDRTGDVPAKGDEVLVCVQDNGGTWTWLKLGELGPASGGFF